ncbi:hypothetical protein BJX61DRAFT_547914 [Aspergillus egyptiacus]|nr:hypothetical protein BJX61DRAFT_547914 [Aspergillus egyptiacus]
MDIVALPPRCGLCSGPLEKIVMVGPNHPDSLRSRDTFVARQKRWRGEGRQPTAGEHEALELGRQRLRRLMAAMLTEHHSNHHHGLGVCHENSYDPRLVSRSELNWLLDFHFVGINERCPIHPKLFFMSRIKSTVSMVEIVHPYPTAGPVIIPGNNLVIYFYNIPPYSRRPLNRDHPAPVFPMHSACWNILHRAAFGDNRNASFSLPILYYTMHKLKEANKLRLPYGELIGGPEQCHWSCVPGEEYCVKSPEAVIAPDRILPARLTLTPRRLESNEQFITDLTRKIRTDPFDTLPCELTDLILAFVPGKDLPALLSASGTLYARTASTGWWRRRIVTDMPWYWELQAYLDATRNSAGEADYKRMYLHLERETTVTYGMTGPFMSLANRRRIWGTCQALLGEYEKTVGEMGVDGDGDGDKQERVFGLVKWDLQNAGNQGRIEE